MDWIRVEDRMPEPRIDVLVVLNLDIIGDDDLRIYEVGWYADDDKEWYNSNGYTLYEIPGNSRVTHWMPLPDLPKEERYDGE
jgi:hypothetical protein